MIHPPKFPRPEFAWQLGTPATKYENPWMRVDDIPAVDPNGKDALYGLVHFKNLAVGVIPYQDGYIWLVGQSRVAFQSYSWEIPAGGDPSGQDPIGTAHRELKEETGFAAGQMEEILHLELSNSITDEVCVVYLATDLTPGDTELESTEDISLMKISLDAALAAIDAGEIRHAIGVAALLKLERMRSLGQLDGR
jgi:8-oxo-dGTP pyrophosphatase MutT (NUDIX family)